jgi:hypothetical protein
VITFQATIVISKKEERYYLVLVRFTGQTTTKSKMNHHLMKKRFEKVSFGFSNHDFSCRKANRKRVRKVFLRKKAR